jgi:hypothetical protein
LYKGNKKVPNLKVSRQCPLVLVNIHRKKSEVFEGREGSMLRCGMLEASSVGKILSIWAGFCVLGAEL